MLEARPVEVGRPPLGGASTSGKPRPIRNAANPDPSELIDDPAVSRYNANGRLFFRLGDPGQEGGNGYVCSGTLVSSQGRNVVITAGHCVVDPPSGARSTPDAAYDIVFVPAYSNGSAPFGQFDAAPGSVVTPRGWRDLGDFRYDIAAVALSPTAQGIAGNLVSSSKIDFGADPGGRSLEIYGYPTEPKPQFDGERLVRCVPADLGQDPFASEPLRAHMAWPCDMTYGASGGGWFLDGQYLASVTSYGHGGNPSMSRRLFGPQLGAAAVNVYTAPQIGGSIHPTVKVKKRPPHRVRKRAVNFRVAGNGSTPLLFKVRLDRKKAVYTGNLIKIRKLSVGRHTVRIRSIDQTSRLSRRTVIKKFRVLPKKKKKKRPNRRR